MLWKSVARLFRRSYSVDAKEAMDWVKGEEIPEGAVREVQLPRELSHLSQDGKVHVAHLADGRRCVLLKKKIGWKGNFEGVFQCDRPLLPSEIVRRSPEEEPYICLAGYGLFEELYIGAVRGDRVIEVYYDLN